MPGDGMAKMIQMLSVLSEIQSRRKQQELAEQQFEESKRQFGMQMGFNEKSQEYKKLGDLLNTATQLGSEYSTSVGELANSLGIDKDKVSAILHIAQQSPGSLDTQRARQIAAGIARMPEGQRGVMQQEAAATAMTGMNQGGVAQSQLQRVLSGDNNPQAAYGKDMLRNMVQGYGERVATGRDPLQAGMQSYILGQPNLLAQGAGIQMGNTTPYQSAQLGQNERQLGISQQQANTAAMGVTADFYRTNYQIIAAAQEAGAKALSAKALGGMTPEQAASLINSQRQISEALNKEKNPNGRKFLAAQYNYLARILGTTTMPEDDVPGPPSYMQRLNPQTPGPSGPPVAPPSYPMGPIPGIPTSPLFNTPQPQFLQPNPLGPFVRP